MLDSIYHMTLNCFTIAFLGHLFHYVCNVVMDVITKRKIFIAVQDLCPFIR